MTFAWTIELSVGDELVDTQHQEIFRRVDALIEAMLERRTNRAIPELFDFLGRYVIEHFGAELMLMCRYSYPGVVIHHAEHQAFLRLFEDLRCAYRLYGASPAVVIDFQKTVCQWLRNHIAKVDKELGKYILGRIEGITSNQPTGF